MKTISEIMARGLGKKGAGRRASQRIYVEIEIYALEGGDGEELLAGGTTLLFVSHSSAAVKRMCQKALWLDAGEMRMTGDVGEVVQAYEGSGQSGK